MSDLIDRQAAIDAILAQSTHESVRELYEYIQEHPTAHRYLTAHWDEGLCAAIDAVIAVDNVPSAQPETILCKDCIFYDAYAEGIEKYQWDGFCSVWARNTYEDWYCSRAERRTDGTD